MVRCLSWLYLQWLRIRWRWLRTASAGEYVEAANCPFGAQGVRCARPGIIGLSHNTAAIAPGTIH